MVVTVAELREAGLIPNRHMWIGNGWMFCRVCNQYAYHDAWSHRGTSDCYEVCRECQCYSGHHAITAGTATPTERLAQGEAA